MQFRQFLRFYVVLCTISLVAQAPIVLFGWEDTTSTPYRFWATVAVLAFAPWAAALLSKVPGEPETRLAYTLPTLGHLVLLALGAAGFSLCGHVFAVALGWSAVDWRLDTLRISLGAPEAYGLSAFPPLWTLFAARFGLTLVVGALIGILCIPMLTAWIRRGAPALERLGYWPSALAFGLLAALPWAPLAWQSALTPLNGLSTALRLLAIAAVAGALTEILRRRSGNLLLAAFALGFTIIFAAEGWGPLFPDAPPAVAGPTGIVHIGFWAAAAAGIRYGRVPQALRRTLPQKPQTKAEVLRAQQAARPSLASRTAPMTAPVDDIETRETRPVAAAEAPKASTSREKAAAKPSRSPRKAAATPKAKAKPKAKTKGAPAKKKNAAAPKKKATSRKPKAR